MVFSTASTMASRIAVQNESIRMPLSRYDKANATIELMIRRMIVFMAAVLAKLCIQHADSCYFCVMEGAIEIVDYSPAYAEAFRELNLDWISASFEVEDVDREVLNDPGKHIIEPGGAIIIALYQGRAVGTCALKRINDDMVEMCKMTVARDMRGKHIGWMLGEAIIEKANQIGASTIELYSNKKGSERAIEMYRKLGFIEIPLTEKAYGRADIRMQMML